MGCVILFVIFLATKITKFSHLNNKFSTKWAKNLTLYEKSIVHLTFSLYLPNTKNPPYPMKHRLHRLLNHSRKFDHFMMICITLSIIELGVETFYDFAIRHIGILITINIAFIMLFTLEYLGRIWVADLLYPELSPRKARIKFMTSANGIIDLMAVLPFYIPLAFKLDLRAIRLLRMTRLLRIFKLHRFNNTLFVIGSIIREKKMELVMTGFVTTIMLVVSSFAMFFVEHQAQPDKFNNIFSALWWAISTLTTVGYGDIYPITGMGRFISAIIALLGIGLIALPTGIIASGFMERVQKLKEEEADSKAHVEKLQQLEEMKRLELVSESEYKELREELIKRFVD